MEKVNQNVEWQLASVVGPVVECIMPPLDVVIGPDCPVIDTPGTGRPHGTAYPGIFNVICQVCQWGCGGHCL